MFKPLLPLYNRFEIGRFLDCIVKLILHCVLCPVQYIIFIKYLQYNKVKGKIQILIDAMFKRRSMFSKEITSTAPCLGLGKFKYHHPVKWWQYLMTVFYDSCWWQYLMTISEDLIFNLWLVILETLITILTIENLVSWQS